MGTEGGTGHGIGVAENFGRLGSRVGWEEEKTGFEVQTDWRGAEAGEKATGGGDVMPERVKRSPRVVAERGAMTLGVIVGADIGVGVEKRLIS